MERFNYVIVKNSKLFEVVQLSNNFIIYPTYIVSLITSILTILEFRVRAKVSAPPLGKVKSCAPFA